MENRKSQGVTDEGQNSQHALAQSPKENSFIAHHPIIFAAIIGSMVSLILPVVSTVWKIRLCNYGWETDYLGILICLPLAMTLAAGIAAVCGLAAGGIGRLILKNTAVKNPSFSASLITALLGAIAGFLISTIPAFIVAFPDC